MKKVGPVGPPTLVTSDGKIVKFVHQSFNLIEEKMFSKKKCLERVSNVSYGSVENGAKKKDDTVFHFFLISSDFQTNILVTFFFS